MSKSGQVFIKDGEVFKVGLVSPEEYQAYLKKTGKRDIGEVLREQNEARLKKWHEDQAAAKAQGLKDPIKSIQIQQGNMIVTQGVQDLLDDIKKVNDGIKKVDTDISSLTLRVNDSVKKVDDSISSVILTANTFETKYTSLSEKYETINKQYEDRIVQLETNVTAQQETILQFKPIYDLYSNVMGIINCSWCDCDASHLMGERGELYASNTDIMS